MREGTEGLYCGNGGVVRQGTPNEIATEVSAMAADAAAWLVQRRRRWIMGTPDEARARIDELGAAGVQRIMLQDFLPRDLDMVGSIGRMVGP